MTLTYFLKVKDSNRDHLDTLNVVISRTLINRVNVIIANTGSCLAFNGVFTFDLGLSKVKVKMMQVFIVNNS